MPTDARSGRIRPTLGLRALVVGALALAALGLLAARPAAAATPSSPSGAATAVPSEAPAGGAVTRGQAIEQLHDVRLSIDRTLALLDAGKRDEAVKEARRGYLDHFEAVEVPLVLVDADLKLDAEAKFAEIRTLIKADASTADIRARIVELRALMNDAERKLTNTGFGAPALVFGQSFIILFREGLEAVLLLSVLFGYLESTKNSQYKRPILYGVGAAVVASLVTFFAVDAIFAALPFGREVLEAVVALLAVAVLFYVSFWLVARLEQRRWLEFLKARVWTAVSAGSATSLALIGFTSVYREGFETALFYQAISNFGTGMGVWILAGVATAAAALAAASFAIFRLGRKLPVRTFLTAAVIVVMATSVAILGNALYALQEGAVIDMQRLDGWPRLPIFLAEATGYYPTEASVLAQVALTVVYVIGGVYTFVIRPRRQRRFEAPAQRTAHGDRSDAGAAAGSVQATPAGSNR